ncbi:hypothetical protein DXG01_008598 [Tephrocybe rancida]|nr:hypothetical protein DXG01_008598 [Tephrocybe rancida]
MNTDGDRAKIKCIQECGDWPNFQLSTAPETLKALGDNITELDLWSTAYNCWVEIDLDYMHVLATDQHILLQRHGVTGADEAEQLAQFTDQPSPQHICYNLPVEHAAVRATLRDRQLVF